jgi:hypothetical protein
MVELSYLFPIALNEMAPHVSICSFGFDSFLPYMAELSTPRTKTENA